MLPDIWGKHAWNFIHLITLAYPQYPTEVEKSQYRDFFYSLVYVLPCKKCRNNLAQNLSNYPLSDAVLSSRTAFVRWGIDLHNIVNKHTGKYVLSYDEALIEINKLVNNGKNNSNNNQTFYLLIIIVIMIGLYVTIRYIQK